MVDDFFATQCLSSGIRIKETLTGPATLADWALVSYPRYYRDPRQFRMDLAAFLHREIRALIDAGCRIIQIDEPALTTNMRDFAMDCEAICETVRGFDEEAYLILHICYSDMKALDRAFPSIIALPFHQIHAEMANRDYAILDLVKKYGFGGKDIGLGVVDVHSDRIETVEEIVAGGERVLAIKDSHDDISCFTPTRVWLLPDCGLKERSEDVARKKLRVITEAAMACRDRFAPYVRRH